MYEDSEKKINWSNIFRRIIIFIGILLVIFGIVALVTRCTKNDNEEKVPTTEIIEFTDLLDEMQEATLKYITKDNLPTELNASKTIKLKYLINKKLISDLKDSQNNACNENSSYSEVTRLENNYAVKLSLTCGQNTDYRIIYIGCFETCEKDSICVGNENSQNGICTIIEKEEPKTETNNNQTTTNTGNNISNTKPNNSNTNNTSNTKPSSSNTNNNTSSNNKKVLYEFKKCNKVYKCANGTLNKNNKCEVQREYTDDNGKVISEQSTYINACSKDGYTYVDGICKKVLNLNTYYTTTYFNTTSKLKNAGYVYMGYEKGKGYKGITCKSGTREGNSCILTESSVLKPSIIPAHCEDSSYSYNSNTNKCSKVLTKTEIVESTYTETCETEWSYSTSLGDGWIRTGNTK